MCCVMLLQLKTFCNSSFVYNDQTSLARHAFFQPFIDLCMHLFDLSYGGKFFSCHHFSFQHLIEILKK